MPVVAAVLIGGIEGREDALVGECSSGEVGRVVLSRDEAVIRSAKVVTCADAALDVAADLSNSDKWITM